MKGVDRIRAELQWVLRHELDDCERALEDRDIEKAMDELDDAIRKIRRVVAHLNELPRD